MKLVPARSQPPSEPVLPMINIVFLLLIFFMLAGALEATDALPVSPPSGNGGGAAHPGETVILVDKEGRTAFAGTEMSEDALRAALRAAVADNDVDMEFWLKGDADAPATRIVEVMELARAAGARRVVLLTVQEER